KAESGQDPRPYALPPRMFPDSIGVTLLVWLSVPAFLGASVACFAAPFAAYGGRTQPPGSALAAGAAVTLGLPLVLFAIGIHSGRAVIVWLVLAAASAGVAWRRLPPREWRLADRGALL